MLSYKALTTSAKAGTCNVEVWNGSNTNIKKQPKEFRFARRIDKVDQQINAGDWLTNNIEFVNEHISVYEKGKDPMRKFNYQNTKSSSHQARDPYVVNLKGAFQPPKHVIDNMLDDKCMNISVCTAKKYNNLCDQNKIQESINKKALRNIINKLNIKSNKTYKLDVYASRETDLSKHINNHDIKTVVNTNKKIIKNSINQLNTDKYINQDLTQTNIMSKKLNTLKGNSNGEDNVDVNFYINPDQLHTNIVSKKTNFHLKGKNNGEGNVDVNFHINPDQLHTNIVSKKTNFHLKGKNNGEGNVDVNFHINPNEMHTNITSFKDDKRRRVYNKKEMDILNNKNPSVFLSGHQKFNFTKKVTNRSENINLQPKYTSHPTQANPIVPKIIERKPVLNFKYKDELKIGHMINSRLR